MKGVGNRQIMVDLRPAPPFNVTDHRMIERVCDL